jgi:hypothetical protein
MKPIDWSGRYGLVAFGAAAPSRMHDKVVVP